MKSSSLSKLLFSIAAAAPASALLSVACGGATVGSDLISRDDGSSGSSSSGASSGGSSGASSGGASSGGSSGTSGASSSGTSGASSSGTSGASSSGTSGSSGASSGASGTSGGCGQPPRTFPTPYSGVLCDPGSGEDAPCETEAAACQRTCEGQLEMFERLATCSFQPDKKTIVCETVGMPCGRAHDGLRPMAPCEHASPVARWLEEAAYLEDASVTSFAILARELEAHGAPAHLVRAAKKSARDEVRHARVMTALAQRHGGRATRSDRSARARATRSLEDMLLENAVEGCVNETYGSLVAWYQAANARDPKVRAAMTPIARDESEHAALAWRIAAWAERRLDDEARARVERARASAVVRLRAQIGVEPSPWLAGAIGLPSAAVGCAMLDSLTDAVGLAA